MCECVCVRACVRACVRECVNARARASVCVREYTLAHLCMRTLVYFNPGHPVLDSASESTSFVTGRWIVSIKKTKCPARQMIRLRS